MSSQQPKDAVSRAEILTMIYKVQDAASRALDQVISDECNWDYVVTQLFRANKSASIAFHEAHLWADAQLAELDQAAAGMTQEEKDAELVKAIEALTDETPVSPAECVHEWIDPRIFGGVVRYRCQRCGAYKEG